MSSTAVTAPVGTAPVRLGADCLLPALFVWTLTSALLLLRGWSALASGMLPDTDDFMRLVEVRDLLQGQAWYDLTQYRLEPPTGVLMHWSRLIDAPIAGLVLLSGMALGPAGAERLALAAWPVVLLLPALLLQARLGGKLAGPSAALFAAGVFAMSGAAFIQFQPGRIDHHNVQMVLALALALAVSSRPSPARLAAAGAATAAMLAIGLETLPLAALATLLVAAEWAAGRTGREASGFGLALALGTSAACVATLPAAQWLVPACDALSAPFLFAALAGGIGLAGLAVAPLSPGLSRLLALGALALVVVVGFAVIAPACLHGPFAELDPRLVRDWLTQVGEAWSVATALRAGPEHATPYVVPLLGLIAAALACRTAPPGALRARLVLAGFLALSVAVSLWQMRAALFAQAFAAPFAAWAIVALRDRFAGHGRPLVGAAALLLAVLAFSEVTYARIASALRPAGSGDDTVPASSCSAPEGLAVLSALPQGVVLAPLDLGPALLAGTPHAVVAAPYHRAQQGLRDALDIFAGTPGEARAIARRRGAAYLVSCTGLGELALAEARAPDGLAARLARGEAPDWLAPVAAPGPLRIWRVTP